jgi:hypothetical protein
MNCSVFFSLAKKQTTEISRNQQEHGCRKQKGDGIIYRMDDSYISLVIGSVFAYFSSIITNNKTGYYTDHYWGLVKKNLSRQFKQVEGQTPMELRRRYSLPK